MNCPFIVYDKRIWTTSTNLSNRTYSFSSGIYLRKAKKKDTGRVSMNVIPVSVVNVE